MAEELENTDLPDEFSVRIGEDYGLWQQYRETHGPEAYKYRRLYEELARQMVNLYAYAEERGIELPGPGPDYT